MTAAAEADVPVPADLAALADAHGVATTYGDWRGRPRTVPTSTVRAVLAAMDVAAGSAEEVAASRRAAEDAPWRRLVAPTVLVRSGEAGAVEVVVPDGPVEVVVTTDQGERAAARRESAEDSGPTRTMDGLRRTRRRVRLPALPSGAHRLLVRAGEQRAEAHLLVTPPRCPVPDGLRAWGWQVQLYALRSAASWGIGDLGDLRTLVAASGAQGAGLVLLNPLHAVMPTMPLQASPYYPASRRFVNPLYLRVEDCDGYARLGADERARVDALAAGARAGNAADRIDRDAAWEAKREALALLAAQPLSPERAAAFAAYQAAEGAGLADFATACALSERHGRTVASWPGELHDPRSAAVEAARRGLSARVEEHLWLQWQCDAQLGAAAAAAGEAGMPVGLVADLAVGVDPGGADAWALRDDLAQAVTVGAPPDSFNQQGQDWRLPPLRPDRLPETGYAPFRALVRSSLRHAGGLRIDHAMGLFRLFWIPEGATAAEGTYVRYPAEALLGVLALEAEAAGAVIVGEDLGTVERGVPETLREHGVLGSRVLWFERAEPEAVEGAEGDADDAEGEEEGPPLPSAEYPALALTSVTTHDLPTAAGYLADEATQVRAALGQLGHDVEVERARTAAERAELLGLLVAEGLLRDAEAVDSVAVVRAMHAFVARTPSLLVTASLADAVGDLRQPNLPGTIDEYPNWRLPVAAPTGAPRDGALLPPSRPLSLEELLASPDVAALAAVLHTGRTHAPSITRGQCEDGGHD